MFFLYPLQFLAIYYYIYVKGKEGHLSKKMGMLFTSMTLIVVVSGSILYFNETLNPEGKVGGSVDVEYAFDYANEYTTGVDRIRLHYGRVATTKRVFESLVEFRTSRSYSLALGRVLQHYPYLIHGEERRSSETFSEFKIGYGFTSMSRIALEYGVLGVVAYSLIVFLFARMCWRYYKYENDPYWKAFAAGSVGFAFSMLFFSFAYTQLHFWGDTLPALYFYAMAVVYTRSKKIGGTVAATERFRLIRHIDICVSY